jgi:threonine synthase
MATDDEVLETIRLVYDRFKIVVDPHTAVAIKVGLERRSEIDGTLIFAETAKAAKFADTIRQALGFEVPVPEAYGKLADLPEYTTRIDPDPEVVKKFIAAHVI